MALFSILSPLNVQLLAIILTLAVLPLLRWLQRACLRMNSQEPPLAMPGIPFVGHLIGILRYQTKYFPMLSTKHQWPIFTMPMLMSKAYVITSAELYHAALGSKTLSFEPLLLEMGHRVCGLSPKGAKIVSYVPKNPKEQYFVGCFYKIIHENLLPGPQLRRMNATAMNKMAELVNNIEYEYQPDSLWIWLRNSFTRASSTALLGSQNPLAVDKSLIDHFWDFEAGTLYLIMDIVPFITARKAFRSRAALQVALEAYYAAGHDLEADVGQVTKALADNARRFGLSTRDIGSFEIGNLHVALANATPALFWLVIHIFADPALTESIRSEVLDITKTTSKSGDRREMTIAAIDISKSCPLLFSTYQETLRRTDYQTASRMAVADTTLSDSTSSYLVKRGSVVHLPSELLHTSSDIWGHDAGTFDARRFLKADLKSISNDEFSAEANKDRQKLQKRAFLPFGGGKNMCPGRHFAQAQILSMVAVLALGYDIVSEDGGPLRVSLPHDMWLSIVSAVAKPIGRAKTMGAKIRRREGWSDVIWKFEVGDGPS